MKKAIYQSPQMKVVKMKQRNILCASRVSGTIKVTNNTINEYEGDDW